VSEAYPFTAIVGQDELREALLISAVCPEVRGLLVRGARGTAKSTAARALLPLLPPVRAAAGEPFAYSPGEVGPGGAVAPDAHVEPRRPQLVELPVGATLDRLLGSLDLGRALAGERAFEAGLLARAHRGVLYVDEVNLLPDHLVDALLDVAASGTARVERDAVSVEHDARFLLVGTMNVEEGELRPQLLDRFGLSVTVATPSDPAERAEIVRRRLAFERDREGLGAQFEEQQAALAARIADAQRRIHDVRLPERELQRITRACAELAIDGARGDITWALAATALAALDGDDEAQPTHVDRAARYALAHRMRRDPLAPPGQPPDLNEMLREGDPARQRGAEEPPAQSRPGRPDPAAAELPDAALELIGPGAGPSGRRARSNAPEAGEIDSRVAMEADDDLAVVPSLVATVARGTTEIRAHVRAGREGALLCLVVDASGSMGARRRAARVKGALLQLLRDAYERRDRVMVVAFRGNGAELLVPAGAPLERAAAAIRDLETGGRTPLAEGLRAATEHLTAAARRERTRRSVAVLVTDGRATDPSGEAHAAAAGLARAADRFHVVDTDHGAARAGLAAALARAAGGLLHTLEPAGGRA
jgi:magnesium chelatase subunit D